MNFVSAQFFIIVAATVILYFVFPKAYRWYVLLASSCFFYLVASGWKAFLVSVFTVAVSYIAAIRIEATITEKGKKKLYLYCALIILLGILVITKVAKFSKWDIGWVIVPLGVSYYTFSIIGYLVDIYSRKSKSERNFLKLLLYTLYFPKIMQGPISKFREIGPKLVEGHSFDYDRFCFGLQLILWGYFKKLIIVERASMITGNIFGNIPDYSGGGAMLLAVTFIATISHYCDFSGYMDIVIGVSQLMGIELDQNFRQPLFSRTAAEFWRRWHITLGVWFKDYVYMTLVINPTIISMGKWVRTHVGKRAGKSVLAIIPLAIVWILTGLWHGTGIDYVLWGCYWGGIIIISNVFDPEIRKLTKILRVNTDSPDWHAFQTVRTFCIFVGGLLISTFVGRHNLKRYFWNIFRDFGIGRLSAATFAKYGLNQTNLMILVAAIALLWIVDANAEKGPVREKIAGMNGVTRWLIYSALIMTILFLGIYGPGFSTSGFAYTHF